MEEVEMARDAAVSMGVQDVGENGNGSIRFWVLVQLLRRLYNRDDKCVLERESKAVEEAKFSVGEVEQFREVFMNTVKESNAFESEAAANRGKKIVASKDGPKELSKDGMQRLLCSLGL